MLQVIFLIVSMNIINEQMSILFLSTTRCKNKNKFANKKIKHAGNIRQI